VKQVVTVRLAPEIAAEVRRYADSFTRAVEQALAMWLARERRKAKAGADPLARHLAPPTTQKIAAPTKVDG
jgi:hypothetical protein